MPSRSSIFATIGNWFAREPAVPVAVAAFGKSAVVNGHQDLAGDATRSLLEFARIAYYEGALPNCTGWEAQLRGGERVLATHLVRWSDGRITIARVSAVAEGGATEKAFAPMLTCAEVDGAFGLDALPMVDALLEGVEGALLGAPPTQWASILAPVRASLAEERARRSVGSPKVVTDAAFAAAHLARLGDGAAAWAESLAEELDLEMSAIQTPAKPAPRGGAAPARSRQTDAPRTGVGIVAELQGWGSFLRSAAPSQSEWWMLGGERIAFVHLVLGRAHERDFAGLWRNEAAAAAIPQPLPEGGRARATDRTGTWIARVMPRVQPQAQVQVPTQETVAADTRADGKAG
jgi:hypothetical protein